MSVEMNDCIITYRGNVVENRHQVHAAIVDATGKLLYAVGDPSRTTLIRSTAKPAQALAILETGCFHQFGFDDADLALMCASHNSEERHISRARAMLAKIKGDEADLRCGGHPALSAKVNNGWIKAGYEPSRITNNCSGKHAGMLAGAEAIGAGKSTYHLPDHPMQLRVKDTVEELTGLDYYQVQWAIDGCNLPAPAIPLYSLGRIYSSLAAAADTVQKGHKASTRTEMLAQIFRAMTQYPELIGGEDRFCTRLMATFQGGLVGKLGADGCYAIGVRESECTQRISTSGAIGISVKIEDGSIWALYSAVMEILQQLQVGTQCMRQELNDFHHPPLLNTDGVTIGRVSHPFVVRSV
ncbi:thermolabile L-asparaginase, putative [Paecilomyces variotii No. 5]|uniref:Thermolabile L-asparaginase, putative n=1 Tax=Byssochlamys spectabilis (strain No. 5 / NBRC 109023) TaxID=1356009 RepID=V5G157_BYSSN|nr:thermolabile L-asparaginase, putative [Paecilomyces variotii No. 5]